VLRRSEGPHFGSPSLPRSQTSDLTLLGESLGLGQLHPSLRGGWVGAGAVQAPDLLLRDSEIGVELSWENALGGLEGLDLQLDIFPVAELETREEGEGERTCFSRT
jgi:hypothetical protein